MLVLEKKLDELKETRDQGLWRLKEERLKRLNQLLGDQSLQLHLDIRTDLDVKQACFYNIILICFLPNRVFSPLE